MKLSRRDKIREEALEMTNLENEHAWSVLKTIAEMDEKNIKADPMWSVRICQAAMRAISNHRKLWHADTTRHDVIKSNT